ncbi:MAG: nucleotidyltransferase family protein, partial [Desulfamplus sp.]|nr:nucleotidyltransferase family protein [Desulfamplus sp.]
MKALILAAGFGTRLLPHTKTVPKPLFPVNGRPLLQMWMEKLIAAGCDTIIVNTHHLHEKIYLFIDEYIRDSDPDASIITVHEPEILDTGGAVKNIRPLVEDAPFFVVNSDVVSNIDLKKVWEFHGSGNWTATLVLHDCPRFNKVFVDKRGYVGYFDKGSSIKGEQCLNNDSDSMEEERFFKEGHSMEKLLAFTGIQVLSPTIFNAMPEKDVFSSIEVYSSLAGSGNNIKAYVCSDIFWQDMGTPEAYEEISIGYAVKNLFKADSSMEYGKDVSMEYGKDSGEWPWNVSVTPLKGDGSDRRWFRCSYNEDSFIAGCHGIQSHGATPLYGMDSFSRTTPLSEMDSFIRTTPLSEMDSFIRTTPLSEMDSFISIGTHLFKKGIPVPGIRAFDRFAGVVILDDLGDMHLEKIIKSHGSCKTKIVHWYKNICDLAINFCVQGIKGFDDGWTFQTPSYSREMILENECRYFMEAFVKGYLKKTGSEEDMFSFFLPSFEFIAREI